MNDIDVVQLQRVVTVLVDCAREWQVVVSIKKLCVLNTKKVQFFHIIIDSRILLIVAYLRHVT